MDRRALALAVAISGAIPIANAQFRSEHSVEGVAAALASPVSQAVIAKAREYDDHLLSQGQGAGQRVYLVTDERSKRVNDIVRKLLASAGEEVAAWNVRVLDTTPQTNNAFVVGGEYVYVFTGFLSAAQSDDEIAFVLGHEIGHSRLKHNERRQNDTGMQISQLAALIAALSKSKTASELGAFSEVFGAQYSQHDEAEADALGAAIAMRAGFNPLRGADFFTRNVKQNDADAAASALDEAALQTQRANVMQVQATCAQWKTAWNSGQMAKTQANADQVNKICADAETQRLAFNKVNADFYNARVQQSLQNLTSSHPNDQSRVAALAATVDFLAGRRDVQSLAKYETAYVVMRALQVTDSVLVRPASTVPAASMVAKPADSGSHDLVTSRLEKLKSAFDSGLITQDEYDGKRKELLSEL